MSEGLECELDHWKRQFTETARRKLTTEWNQSPCDSLHDACVHQLFEAQVARTPEALALEHNGQALTYRQLNRRANQLADHLQELGVGPEVRVGIAVERSPELVIGLLGILKAGGAYVPLDPAYPLDRVAFMLQDCQASVLLTQQRLVETLPSHSAKVVFLDTDWPRISERAELDLACSARPMNLAYVIYTSGSTGRPKGVAIEHHSTVSFIRWALDVFTSAELSGVLASTSVCFDLSVFELFVPLSCGGRVILVDNVMGMQSLPTEADVKLINTVPSAITELLRLKSIPESVTTVNLAGEPLSTELVGAIYRQTRAKRVYDLYGPSETTTYSTYALRLSGVPATIGRPIANTQVFVLDENLRPVPTGIAGELYIAGEGVAREYLNRPDLTAERFVPNPFSCRTGDRMYRTGDLARWLADGNLAYLGRVDQQVKLRGFRIELGEIEALLAQHPLVTQAVVVLREDRPGDKRLVAYIVPADAQSPPVAEALRTALEVKLANYMVPSAYVVLGSLPLTPNGKLDRKALPPPDQSKSSLHAEFVAPRDALEEALVRIWADLLGVERVGVYDNFFLLGGHSLLAARLFGHVHQYYKSNLTLETLIDTPTVAGVAASIKGHRERSANRDSKSPARANCRPEATTACDEPSSGDAARSRSLVPAPDETDYRAYFRIQREGSRGIPVACVGDTRPLPFILTRLPPTVPVFSLLLDGAQKTWPPRYLTIDEQIAVYVEALERLLSTQRVFLFGYSYGGLLAARLATLLRTRGWMKVDLMMIEPEVPLRYVSLKSRFRYRLSRMRQFLSALPRHRWYRHQLTGQPRIPRWESVPDDNMARWNHMLPHYDRCIANARLSRTRERFALAGSEKYHAFTDACWRKIGLGGVDRCRFPDAADHFACFREPHVSAWLDLFEKSYPKATTG